MVLPVAVLARVGGGLGACLTLEYGGEFDVSVGSEYVTRPVSYYCPEKFDR